MQEFYELRINRIDNANKQSLVNDYLRSAFLPALSRLSIDQTTRNPACSSHSATSRAVRRSETGNCSPLAVWPLEERWVPSDRRWHYDRSGEAGSEELLAKVLYRRPMVGVS